MSFAISNLSEVWAPYNEELERLAASMFLATNDMDEIKAFCSEELSEMFDEDELEMF